MQLAGRTALVTGGAIRLGKAIALTLAARGMRVGVHYNASADAAARTVDEITRQGGEARTFRADLSKADTPTALIANVADAFGRLDVLVNSAAVMMRTPVGEVSSEQWDAMFALNLRAPFFLTQAAAPLLGARNGAVVNIADLAAFETWPTYVPHSITKAGLVQMTRALARALAPAVRVNAVAPGPVLLPDDWSDDDGARLEETTPLRRLGTPEDAARAVVFLLEEDYVTGETIIVDGGRHVRR